MICQLYLVVNVLVLYVICTDLFLHLTWPILTDPQGLFEIIRLHQMHEVRTIVTSECGVCPSACQSVCHMGSFGAAFAKSLWPHFYN